MDSDNKGNWVDFMKMVEQIMTEKYGVTVMDHIQNPRNLKMIKDANGYASNTGQCGDTIEIWLRIKDYIIEEIAFKSNGCEITRATASMATELVKGKNLADALKITPVQLIDALGGLPEDHIHCAYLAMRAIHEAINNYQKNNQNVAG
ncbi:MAG: iron-sulfur cluster assembly scaffold protein [Bacillota bacterium]|nr:iron-sulfur cluster assembly scaffold protein [Clostridia bacterium]